MSKLMPLLWLVFVLTAVGAPAQQVTASGSDTNAPPIFTGSAAVSNSTSSQSGNVPTGEANGVFNPTVCAGSGAPAWCSATLITSQTPGSGYSLMADVKSLTCTVTGGTVASQGLPSSCGAWLRTTLSRSAPSTGIYVAITSLGNYTSPPIGISVAGATGGSGFGAALGTGSDVGFWTNAAFAYCRLTCTVHIPAGTYSYSTTINMTTIHQSLIGDGPWQTLMTYTGSGDGIFWQAIPFSVGHAGRLKGITLNCTSAAMNGVHSGTIEGSTWEDLLVSGATGPNANNVLLENSNGGWTERTYMRNVWFGDSGVGGTSNLHLLVNGGTRSFGYSDIQIWQNVEAGQSGVIVDSSAYVYNSTLEVRGNIDNTNSRTSFFKLNFGQIVQSRVNIYGEEGGAGDSSQAIYIKGQLVGTGTIQIYANRTSGASTSGLVTPTIVCPSIPCASYVSLTPFNSFDYPWGTPIAKAFQKISADETIVAIQADAPTTFAAVSGGLSGRLLLVWPNDASRYQEMEIDVACANGDTARCTMNIPLNYSYAGQAVITNPQLVETPSHLTQILVTIRNRNGGSQNLIATWFGDSNERVFLLPETFTSLGTTPVTSYGANFSSATTYGLATLSSGIVTISNPLACTPSANCIYRLTRCGSNSSTAVGVPTVDTVTAGTSFVIKSLSSSNTVVAGDLASICWQIN